MDDLEYADNDLHVLFSSFSNEGGLVYVSCVPEANPSDYLQKN